MLAPVYLSLFISMAAAAASGAEGPLGGDHVPGAGESYWGPIPAPADSVTAAFEQPPVPLWARAVDLPYDVVGVPVRLVVNGIKETAVALDEGGVIRSVTRLLKPRDLPYGVVLSVDAGGLAGFGGGATAVHDAFFGPDNRFRLGFKVTTTGNDRVVLGTHINVGHVNELQLGSGYRVRPNARFFGIGPGAREADESFYTDELGWVGATLTRHANAWLALELTTLYTAFGARAAREDDADEQLATVFADAVPSGYRDRSDGLTFGLVLASDTTTRTGTPEGGTIVRAGASYFHPTGGSNAAYWSYRGELQGFVPLWFDERALALRAVAGWIDPVAGGGAGAVPFQRLLFNDDPDLMRGYRDYRWRDRGMAIFTAEYRWPIWAGRGNGDFGVHMYIFGDLGQVFGDPGELALRHLTESWGAGVRAVSWGRFVGRVEVGVSEEETVFRVRADQVFQFHKGGLYHGRNPVPAR